MIGRLPRSRSPPQPNTTMTRPVVNGRTDGQHVLQRVGLVRIVDIDRRAVLAPCRPARAGRARPSDARAPRAPSRPACRWRWPGRPRPARCRSGNRRPAAGRSREGSPSGLDLGALADDARARRASASGSRPGGRRSAHRGRRALRRVRWSAATTDRRRRSPPARPSAAACRTGAAWRDDSPRPSDDSPCGRGRDW